MISPNAMSLIEQFKQTDWFCHVGQPMTAPHVAVVKSWAEAGKSCASLKWEHTRLDARNDLSMALDERFTDRYQAWNDIIEGIDERLMPTMEAVVERVSRRYGLPPQFARFVKSDARMACVEADYADLVPPGFYMRLAAIYLDGHFPCGWRGRWPKGKVVVF